MEITKEPISQAKVLTSESAQNKKVTDPKARQTTEEAKGKGLLEENNSKAPRKFTQS